MFFTSSSQATTRAASPSGHAQCTLSKRTPSRTDIVDHAIKPQRWERRIKKEVLYTYRCQTPTLVTTELLSGNTVHALAYWKVSKFAAIFATLNPQMLDAHTHSS